MGFLKKTARIQVLSNVFVAFVVVIAKAAWFLKTDGDKPVRVRRIFSTPGSVKSWIPNFKIMTVNERKMNVPVGGMGEHFLKHLLKKSDIWARTAVFKEQKW